jgi:hypothetical protein
MPEEAFFFFKFGSSVYVFISSALAFSIHDADMGVYLVNEEGPVPLMMYLRIVHVCLSQSDSYFYKIIGKLTVFFTGSGVQFPQHNTDSSISVVRRSPRNSNPKSD